MANIKYFELDVFKRYFHLVAFQSDKKYNVSNFLQDLGGTITRKNNFSHNLDFIVYEGEINSNLPYYNGEKDYSLNNNGQPPYRYEIFAVQIYKPNIFIVAFPFKLLAKSSVNNAIEKKRLMSKGSFVRCDINKLLAGSGNRDLSDDEFLSYFSGLDFTLTGEENISSVNLDGDKPLEANLYRQVFSKLFNAKKCHLERCSLQCKIQYDIDFLPKAKANVHIDIFGNYKLYIHGGGKNIFIIPYLFNLLNVKDCLKTTLSNPIDRLQDE